MIRLAITFFLLGFALHPLSALALDDGQTPRTAEELVQAGGRAYHNRDYDLAAQHFERFLEAYGEAEEAREAADAVRPLLAICHVRRRAFDRAAGVIGESLKQESLEESLGLELTFWQGVCRMQLGDLSGAQATFADYYGKAPAHDPRRSEAVLLYGTIFLLQNRHAEAISFLKLRIEEYEKNPASASEVLARLMSLQLHAFLRLGRLDDALLTMSRTTDRFDQFVQIIGLQSLILELGSRLLDEGRYYDAIRCFHYVWPRDRLLSLQAERKERVSKRIRSLKARGDADALVFQLEGIRTRIERELVHFAQVKDYDAAVQMRLASAYLGLQRYREAALIMESMLADMEPSAVVEEASVTLVKCWMQEEEWERAAAAADLYGERFAANGRKAPHALEVLFLKGQAWQGVHRFEDALEAFEECVAWDPKSATAAKAFFMRGICLLQMESYEKAVLVFRELPVVYPGSETLVERALYWEGMAHSFAAEPERCLERMRRYVEAFPTGTYLAEAVFRIAFSQHALADYEASISGLTAFLGEYSESPHVDEARLLLGDAHLARGELEEGMAQYAAIRPESTSFFEEGLFKTGEALKLSERFGEMEAHFQSFVDAHADSARLPEALHWLAWLKQREGNVEEARSHYWASLDRLGNEPDMPSVLDLAGGLAKLYVGPQRPVLIGAWRDRRQEALREERSTYAARCLWAQAQAMKETQPVQSAVLLTELASELKPEIHSARMLVDAADALRSLESWTEAASLYREVAKWHPDALERERAEEGLGREALRVNEYARALDHFERIERRAVGLVDMGEILLAKASCQRSLGRGKAAFDTLENLLANRSISSEAKAAALLQSGQWLAETGESAKALVYFERVYLVYGRYAREVAAAYWARGRLLEDLGENEKARAVFSEFVSREDLEAYPEYARAQAHLAR